MNEAKVLGRSRLAAGAAIAVLFSAGAACSSGSSNGANSCTPGDNDGTMGGSQTFLVTVSDTAFAVGGVDSGSTEMNITTQNLTDLTIVLTNVGTRPHDMVVGCVPTGLPAGCAPISCFPNPDDAGSTSDSVTLIPAVAPGASATVMFTAPLVEGKYMFVSDQPGDDSMLDPDGGATGNLVGEFVLM